MTKNRSNKKRPKSSVRVYGGRHARVSETVNVSQQTVLWSMASFDHEAEWWDASHVEETFRFVGKRMKMYERMTWGQIESNQKRDHPVKCGKLDPKAQKRLTQLRQDDVDELWRFRFNGLPRIWGIREGRLFKVLWWDPLHKVCPSDSK